MCMVHSWRQNAKSDLYLPLWNRKIKSVVSSCPGTAMGAQISVLTAGSVSAQAFQIHCQWASAAAFLFCRGKFEGTLESLSQFQTREAQVLMTEALEAMDMMNNAIILQNEVLKAQTAYYWRDVSCIKHYNGHLGVLWTPWSADA